MQHKRLKALPFRGEGTVTTMLKIYLQIIYKDLTRIVDNSHGITLVPQRYIKNALFHSVRFKVEE